MYAGVVCFFFTACFECLIKVKSPEYDKQEGKNPLAAGEKGFSGQSPPYNQGAAGYPENLLCDQRDHASDPRGKRGRISLYYPECSGAEFHLLWLFRKRCRAGSHSRRDPGRSGSLQDQWKQYIPAHRRAGLLSDPAGNFFPAVRESLYPVRTLVVFSVLIQLAACGFSIFATSFIQRLTPGNMIGKISSYSSSFSQCIQPLGQIFYGVLFDCFSGGTAWILICTGILMGGFGLMVKGFYEKMEKEFTEN